MSKIEVSEVPWEYSRPATPGKTTVENLPSPEGAELGREMARLADIEETKRGKLGPKRCDDCALQRGTRPNQSVTTLMDVIKCVAEHEAFYCHKGVLDGDEPKRACGGYLLLVGSERLAEHLKRSTKREG